MNKLVLLLKIVVAGGILYFIEDKFELKQYAAILDRPWLLLLPVFGWALNQVLTTVRLHTLMRMLNIKVGLRALLEANFAALFLGNLMPGSIGADVIKFFYIRQSGVSIARTELAIILAMDRFFGLVAILFICSLFAFLLMDYTMTLHQLIWVPLILLSGAILALIGASLIANIGKRLTFLPAMIQKAIHVYERLIHKDNTKLLLTIFFYNVSAVVVLLGSLVAVGSFLAWGQSGDAKFAEQAFLIPLSLIVAMVPLTPLGIGTSQISMLEAYKWLSVDPKIGVFVTTVSQLALVLLSIVVGGPLFLRTRKKGDLIKADPIL